MGGLLWVLPVYGQASQADQAIRQAPEQDAEEGFPGKRVFQDESVLAPVFPEECDAFSIPDEFGEGCREHGETRMPGPGGVGQGTGGFPGGLSGPSDSVFRTAPRLECPAIVFVEEMETGSIDCEVYDEAGEEHIDYYWEPVEGAPQDYLNALDAPRLIGENTPAPLVVAPSSPSYATLESFLSEEATLRYRYRLTAASRVTGLSSQEEVEVFVLLRRPSVYCPLEYEVPAGSEVVLSCEGADPLSFRMDYEEGSSVSWEWEGLWGASASLLSGADTPSPSFRAPLGGSGETYDYVASMTTTSSGVPRTARRRVSVTVKAAEGVSAPGITCEDSPYDVYEGSGEFDLNCAPQNAPEGVVYRWTGVNSNANVNARLKNQESLVATFIVPGNIPGSTDVYTEQYQYEVTMYDGAAALAQDRVSITVRERPDIDYCLDSSTSLFNEGEAPAPIPKQSECGPPTGAPGNSPAYRYEWKVRGANTPDDALSRLSSVSVRLPEFTPPADVNKDVLYHYSMIISAENADPFTFDMQVFVRDTDVSAFGLVCTRLKYRAFAGQKEDITLKCDAPTAPSDTTWKWVPTSLLFLTKDAEGNDITRQLPLDFSRLDNPNTRNPLFDVPLAFEIPPRYKYQYWYTVSVSAGSTTEERDVVIEVSGRSWVILVCSSDNVSLYEGADDITIGNCIFTNRLGPLNPARYRYKWTAKRTTDTARFPDQNFLETTLSADDIHNPVFYVPENVEKHEEYEYLLRIFQSNDNDDLFYDKPVIVRVLNRDVFDATLALSCESPVETYAGAGEITLSCTPEGAPDDRPYAFQWDGHPLHKARLVAGADGPTPTFLVPDGVDAEETYEYDVTVTAANSIPATEEVIVRVLKRPDIRIECPDNPYSTHEGSGSIALECKASDPPDDLAYAYGWEARGATADTGLLNATDVSSPTFDVPDDVDADETYEYRLTVSARNMVLASKDITVTVLDNPDLALTCNNPAPVYEGEADITLDCSAEGDPSGSEYDYAWTHRGATANTDRLVAGADGPTPTFAVPEEVSETMRYEYALTVTADNADPDTEEITVTVLNKGVLALSCPNNPYSVYEGEDDITLSCEASDAPEGSSYAYAWEARGETADTDLLSATNVASPTFFTPDEVDEDLTFEYRLTVSAENAEGAMADITVRVLNRVPPTLALSCPNNPYSVYEGEDDITLSCEASDAPEGSSYAYAWEARGETADTDLLSATNVASPTFFTPDEVEEDLTYEYRLTVSAENAEGAMADITIRVLNRVPPTLALSCPDNPYSVYEGEDDITLECEASGAPEGSSYAYAWEARGETADTDLLSATNVASPTFFTPDEVEEDLTYEYRLTVSAENAEGATAEITVTARNLPDPTSPQITISASSLRFGVQSPDTQVSLDPLTDRISTSVSGPHHTGRMMLAPADDLAFDENGEAVWSIEMVAPVALRHEADASASVTLAPRWSYAASCDQISSEAIYSSFFQARLSESDCRLLLFGGDLDLTGASPGNYSGALNVILRSEAGEETRSVQAQVTVVPAQRAITIGPGGVRFDTSHEVPPELTFEQNLSIYPDVAFLTSDAPHGSFELSNPSLVPLEVSVSARFGYTEATEDGRETVVEDKDASPLGDLSEALEIYPSTLVLLAGEQAVVRYGIREEALASMRSSMKQKGYAAFFDVASSPRQYARADFLPESVASSGRTGRASISIPGAYAPDADTPRLRAALLSLSEGVSPTATFLVETDGAPFAGEAVAYDGEGRELGRSSTLVYTRSRVRVSLDRLPEDETVFLRFAPRGSGRLSAPVSVPWNAPRRNQRDIGAAAQDSGKAPLNN